MPRPLPQRRQAQRPVMGVSRREGSGTTDINAFGRRDSLTVEYHEVSFLRRRFCAFLIDSFIALWILGLVSVVVTAALLGINQFENDSVVGLTLLSFVFITYYFYHLIFWSALGATPGKWILKLRVVDADGREIRFARALARTFGYLVSLGGFGIGFFLIPFDPLAQGWHDKIAGTYVVYEGAWRTVNPRGSQGAVPGGRSSRPERPVTKGRQTGSGHNSAQGFGDSGRASYH